MLGSVLTTFRLRGARYCASELSVPWAIHFAAHANPIFHVVDRGAAWLILPDAVPLALVGGDVVLLPHGHAHTPADEPERTPQVVDFDRHPQIAHGGGPAIWGGGGALTLLVCGECHVDGPQLQPLLGELPPCILRRAGEASQWLTMTLRVLAAIHRKRRGIAPFVASPGILPRTGATAKMLSDLRRDVHHKDSPSPDPSRQRRVRQ